MGNRQISLQPASQPLLSANQPNPTTFQTSTIRQKAHLLKNSIRICYDNETKVADLLFNVDSNVYCTVAVHFWVKEEINENSVTLSYVREQCCPEPLVFLLLPRYRQTVCVPEINMKIANIPHERLLSYESDEYPVLIEIVIFN